MSWLEPVYLVLATPVERPSWICGRQRAWDWHSVGVVRDYPQQLAEDAALWSTREVTTSELVRLACDALVDGLDSQALRELAGASDSTSVYEVEDMLERVAEDFGFRLLARDSEGGRLAATRVLAAQCVAGQLMPREFARWMQASPIDEMTLMVLVTDVLASGS
jgi:hypothetical protein